MKTEIEFLEHIKYEFETAHYGEGISFNLSNMSNEIRQRLSELKKLRVTDVSVSVCEFGCEKCGMNFSGAQQMLLHSRICPKNVH